MKLHKLLTAGLLTLGLIITGGAAAQEVFAAGAQTSDESVADAAEEEPAVVPEVTFTLIAEGI